MSTMSQTNLNVRPTPLQSTCIQESRLRQYWNTILPHLKNSLIASVTGVSYRIFSLPDEFRVNFSSPLKYIDKHENLAFHGVHKYSMELTHSNIEERGELMGDSEIPKERLHYIVDRTHQLAKKLNITQEVKIFPGPVSSGLGTYFSSEVIVLIDVKTAKRSEEIIDFILAHELAHVAHNHTIQRAALKIFFMSLDVLSASMLSPWAIPVCEAIAAPVENFAYRVQEKQADLSAIKILTTNAGAVEFFRARLTENKEFRNDSISFFKGWAKNVISPEGDIRLDIVHPALTKRLAYTQLFFEK